MSKAAGFMAIWAATSAGAMSPEQAREQFRQGWAKTECALQHPTYQPAYSKCHEAANGVLWMMDMAFVMRSSCPHPVFFAELTQLAYDCSDSHKGVDGAQGADVGACFEEAFIREYNPASVHYCSELEAVTQ